ncbi:MAG: hypothetical protein AABX51_06585 [Nanoarchaeota archaeon]
MKQKTKIFFEDARNEMKRADHLMFVSLKYTRTVDVIKSLVERLTLALEGVVNASLETAKDRGKIDEVPSNMGLKRQLLLETFKDPSMEKVVDMHGFFKKILKSDFKRSNEFRRYVTMTVMIDTGILNIDIDKAKEYYELTKQIIENAELFMNGGEINEMIGRGL